MAEFGFQNTKYRLVKKIAEGAWSILYLVESEGKQFALKSLKSSEPDALTRFRRESSTLARLNHVNLVKLVDVGQADNTHYLVMEFLDGVTLAGKLRALGKMAETECVSVVSAIADGLGEIHKNNLVHRDIKPSNIFVTPDGIKIIDLGLVGDIEEVKTETALVGTPLYCSPEQTKILNRPVSFSSDLYSLGILFFEILTGAPPFSGTLSEILQQHLSTLIPNLRILRPSTRPSVIAIIEKLLSKDPDDRYQSASSLIHDLGRLDEIDVLIQKNQELNLGEIGKKSFAVRIKYIERTAEIESLHKAWMTAQGGQPGLFIVKGASGSGKTRLSSEFINRASIEGKNSVLVLKGKSQFFDRDMPFGALRESIDSLMTELSLESAEVQTEVHAKIALAGQGLETDLLKFSKSLIRVFKKNSKANIETDIEGEKEKYFNSIAEFFTNLSKQWNGLILFIDDLQWLDGSSIQLLDRILNQVTKSAIFVLGTARNDVDSLKSLRSLEETLGTAVKGQLELGSFSKTQMSNFLSSYLGANILDEAIVDLFYSKSNGNPFIAAEYLRGVVDQGFLLFKDNKWQVVKEGLEKIAFSKDVYELIVRRIDGGTRELKAFLQYASIYGNTFTVSDIARVAQINSSELGQVLAEGERLGLLDRLSAQKSKFSHDKIPESLRQSLDEEATKKICDELVAFYRKKENKSDDEIFILARLAAAGHFEKDLNFTVAANTEAGLLSFSNHAHAQAYTFLKCAYELSKKMNLEREALREISSKLAICATMISDWPVAEETVQKALDLSQGRDELADSLILKVWVKKALADISTAWECFVKASGVLDNPYPIYFHWKLLNTLWLFSVCIFLELTGIRFPFLYSPEKKRAKNLSKLADLYVEAHYCGEYREFLDFVLISLKILLVGEISGRKRELALGYACTGYAFACLGIRAIGVPFLNKAVLLSEELNDPVVRAACISRRIDGFVFSGVEFDYTAEFEKYFEITKRYLNPADLGRFRNSRAMVLTFKGRNEDALDFVKSFLSLQNPDAARINPLSLLNALHVYWFNLSILGRAQEAQAAKRIALARASRYRCVLVAQLHVALYELQLRRYTEEFDELVYDLREKVGRYPFFRDMNSKFNFSHTVFLDLLEFEKATNREEKFSTRKRFKHNLQRLYFMLYAPAYRINYYLLNAMYCRIIRKFGAAKKWLELCEKTASATGHVRIMFEVKRELARIYLKTGEIMRMKANLISAVQMSIENQWGSIQETLAQEFVDYMPQLQAVRGQTVSLNKGAVSTDDMTLTGSKTVMQYGSSLTPQDGQTVMGTDELGDTRFVDALLQVTHAFVSSLEFMEQSRSVLTQIVKLFAAERGFVFIKNEDSGEFKPIVAKDSQGADLKLLAGYSSLLVKKALESSTTQIVSSLTEAEALGSESAVLHNLRSIIVTPLKIKDKVFGAVYLDSSLMKGLFSKRDVHLFSTLSNHISVAFELSRMAKVEREKAELRKQLEIQEAVATEAKKVEVLVDNMQQALFSIDAAGTIVEPVSRYSEKVLGRAVVGEKLIRALYKDVPDQQILTGIETALNTVFGEDELQWDLMTEQFPRKINFHSETDKILKVQPSPIWDNHDQLEKIVFVVEDITAYEELEKKLKEQGVQATILSEILQNDFQDLQEFLLGFERNFSALRTFTGEFNQEKFLGVLRDLHTLKGNSRVYKLSLVSGQIHEVESSLVVFKDNLQDQSAVRKTLDSGLDKIAICLRQYQVVFEKIAKAQGASGGNGVSELALSKLVSAVETLEKTLPNKDKRKLRLAVERLSYKSVKEVAQKFASMVSEVSKQLGKQVEYTVNGDALISSEKMQLLKDCLLHLLRNSVDHGFEAGAERVKVGKSDLGHLKVECADEGDSISIAITDDGGGIDGNHVLQKAIEKGILNEADAKTLSPDEKINLIFSPNFSTKEEVSEISGRGIGLDVVKKNIEAMNGELKVTTQIGKGSKFLITLKSESSTSVQKATG